jgi:predicted DNA-binding antitoxin AbrB/MazE fold protein
LKTVYLACTNPTNYGEAMNTVEAIYEKGVFRPIGKIDLNEGDKVEITVKPFSVKDSAETIPDLAIDLGISDFAENIDHYLYDLPKQS